MPSKCELFGTEVKYLRHVVSSGGVSTNPEKVRVVKNWEVPGNVKTWLVITSRILQLSTIARSFLRL